MVKSLKGVVCKVCREENGHVVMMGLFDCVDDTVLIKKALLAVSHPTPSPPMPLSPSPSLRS